MPEAERRQGSNGPESNKELKMSNTTNKKPKRAKRISMTQQAYDDQRQRWYDQGFKAGQDKLRHKLITLLGIDTYILETIDSELERNH